MYAGKFRTRALTFSYKGIARGEIMAARRVCATENLVEHRFVNLPDVRESGDIPGGRFEGLPPTYIPMRNAIYYSLASAYAEEVGADLIVGGHNRDDPLVFPDSGAKFFKAFERMVWAGSPILERRGTRIVRPLKARTKARVVRLGHSLKVPFELTWSCHRDGSGPCWTCDGCRGRSEAFYRAGVVDPLRTSRAGKIS